MAERRPTNSELRLRQLAAEERDPGPRGILEIFDEEPVDADAPLAREDVAVARQPLELVGGELRSAVGEPAPEVELPRHLGAARAGDDVRAHLCETPFREIGMLGVEHVRDGELEHAVAEELEPLVRGAAVARPRGVREDRFRDLRRKRFDQLREATGAT